MFRLMIKAWSPLRPSRRRSADSKASQLTTNRQSLGRQAQVSASTHHRKGWRIKRPSFLQRCSSSPQWTCNWLSVQLAWMRLKTRPIMIASTMPLSFEILSRELASWRPRSRTRIEWLSKWPLSKPFLAVIVALSNWSASINSDRSPSSRQRLTRSNS